MSAVPAEAAVPFVPGGPESAFRVGPVLACGEVFHGGMQTGEWVLGPDGRPCAGALGVLIDDILGYPVVASRPAGFWAASTEISVDFCGPLPAGGAAVRGEGRVVGLGFSGGLADARVLDESGSVIAVGRQRLRFIPGTPPALTGDPAGAGPLAWPLRPAPVLDQLGAALSATEDGVVLRFPLVPALANPMGTLHGGIMLCASELAGHAAAQQPGSALSTASVHISYLRPGPVTGRAAFEATVLHRGRTLAVTQVISRNEAGKTCTLATVTCHLAD